jgi:hypothetical protein
MTIWFERKEKTSLGGRLLRSEASRRTRAMTLRFEITRT